MPNEVGGNVTCKPEDVEARMNGLLKEYNALKNVTVEDIIRFHDDFEKIHPFQDGNGRIGHVIMFKECLENSIVPFIILDTDKMFYYRGLKQYENEKRLFVRYLPKCARSISKNG